MRKFLLLLLLIDGGAGSVRAVGCRLSSLQCVRPPVLFARAHPPPASKSLFEAFDACKALPVGARCEAALRLLAKEPRADVTACRPNAENACMRLCAPTTPAAVETLFSSLGDQVDATSFASLIEARLAARDLAGAHKAAMELLAHSPPLRPRRRSLGRVLCACCAQKQPALALTLWDGWRNASAAAQPAHDEWAALICLHVRCGESDHLATRLAELRRLRVPLTASAVEALSLELQGTGSGEGRLYAAAAGGSGFGAGAAEVGGSPLGGPDVALRHTDIGYHVLIDAVVGAAPALPSARGGAGAARATEQTVALIKPDAVAAGHAPAIMEAMAAAGFTLVRQRQLCFDTSQARHFLRVSWGSAAGDPRRRYFEEMVGFYASGAVVVLLLEREDAIAAWRALLGPGDPARARVDAPLSLRARFGTDRQANAVHGADSEASAQREMDFFFPDRDRHGESTAQQRVREGSG